jgi:3-hydroxy acid dehydrogenase/malonic semialdehyde reductase
MASLEGKKAVVTGASSGIGAATARALSREGAVVAGGARRVEALTTEVALPLDVTDEGSCEHFVGNAVERLGGRLDILVNNAGLALGRESFEHSKEQEERAVLETNVNGLVRLTRHCFPHFEGRGHIVNIGSVAGRWPYENAAVYCLSKAAVHAFSRALREDFLGQPLRVTAIAPGLAETDFSRVRFHGDEEKASSVYDDIALGGPLRAEDIAECVVFAVTRPLHVNVDEIVVMPVAQTSRSRIARDS